MREVLAYMGAGMVGMWGIAHAIPTPQVVSGFEPTSIDNHPGAKTRVIWFRICPMLLTSSAALLVLASITH